MIMKTKKTIENAKLGGLVIAGILFLVFTLYMIGKNQNMFGASITVTAVVESVNGLVPGNDVRFKGMNVGTVKSVDMANDSAIHVVMYVQKKMVPFIRNNSLTSIGSDGLMGNKLIQIFPQKGQAETIQDGDIIYSISPVSTDEMLKRIGTSTEFVEKTTENLFEITTKLKKSESLWGLLSDSLLTEDIKEAVVELKMAASNAADMTKKGSQFMNELAEGKGLVQKILTDEELADEFSASLGKLRESSDQAVEIVSQINSVIDSLEAGEGTVGLLLKDPSFRDALSNSMLNLEMSTERFNENMEAMRSNFLFRRFFKRQEKERSRELSQ